MRWEVEEELMEERRLFNGKQVDLLEPRLSLTEGAVAGLGMAGLDAMLIEGRL
jgi:hypothetical protein